MIKWVECSPMAWVSGVQSNVNDKKDSKMVLDASLLKTQHYKVGMMG